MVEIKFSRIILIIVFLGISSGLMGANISVVKAITVEEFLSRIAEKIAEIQTHIVRLQQQIVELKKEMTVFEINPYDADVETCTSSNGEVFSATGEDSASWFVWGGCAHNKYYYVNPGQLLRLYVQTDSCPGCVCYYPNFYVYEYQNGDWVQVKYFDLPEQKTLSQDVYFTPRSDKIKIYAPSCFYLDIFSPMPLE